MKSFTQKLAKKLVETGSISEAKSNHALDLHQRTGEKFENIILKNNWITEDALLEILENLLGLPSINLEKTTIDKTIIDTIPLPLAKKYRVIPIIKMGNELAVGMSDPLNVAAIDAIQYRTGCKLLISVAIDPQIEQAIEKYYSLKNTMDQVVQDLNETNVTTLEEVEKIQINEDSDESSVIKLVNLVLLQAIHDRASDIHFEPDENVFRIRCRIDGLLHEIFTPPKNLQANIISRIKIMADMDVSERRIPQDGRFSIKTTNKEVDVRASILPTVAGEKAVLRILDKASSILKLSQMGFSEKIFASWETILKKTEGIILITGPTGSGKSTTLYAVLNEINTIDKNIVTVENPVEYQLPLINQVHVNEKAGLTFASGLRSILRQDPDVIMIGEIRDRETAEIAIRAALTGHLVFSTLHTNDAPGAIARLMDMGLEPFLVESSVIAVLAQRLVRKVCPRCKTEKKLTPEEIDSLQLPEWLQLDTVFYGRGCNDCNNSGYRGRTSIHELLVMNDEIRRLIIGGASTDKIWQAARNKGMRNLKEDGLAKVEKGFTTIEEVLRVAF